MSLLNLPMPSPVTLSLMAALTVAFLWALYFHARLRGELSRIEALARRLAQLPHGRPLEPTSPAAPALLLTGAINEVLTRAEVRERRAAEATRQLFAELGDRIHEAVLVHTDVILYANRQFAHLIGVPREALLGRRLAQLVPAEYVELVNGNIRARLAGAPAAERYEVDVAGEGRQTRLELSSAVIGYENRTALLITGVEVIPTNSLPTLKAAGSAAVDAGLMLDSLPTAVVATDDAGQITYVNPAAEELLGELSERLRTQRLDSVVTLVDETDQRLLLDPVRQSLRSGAPVSLAQRALLLARADGSERSVELAAAPMHRDDTALAGAVVALHDVTGLRGLARQVSYQAMHDALTGLISRPELDRRLKAAIDSGHRGEGPHLLCWFDLERLRVINEAGGSHQAGDAVLREAARLLEAAVRDSDTVARVGGDEMAILLSGCPLAKGRQIATDLCNQMSRHHFQWRERVFNIGVSAGVVEISRESGTPADVLACAESACHIARRQGEGRVLVYSAHDEALARHSGEIRWLQRLSDALRESRFELHQQPIVVADTDHGQGGPAAEVLLRLKDDAGAELPVAEILRLAERYELLGRIDRWVVHTTLAALARGDLALPPGRSVAINIAGQTLSDAQFLHFVVESLDSTGVAPGRVCFEISERAVTAHPAAASRFVEVLHGMGCQFTLDDFGAHSGSLTAVRSLPLDHVKIDGCLVRTLAGDPLNQAVVASLVKLARSLRFKVIAEGLEDAAALEAVRRLGVDYLQGFLTGRPTPLLLTPEPAAPPAHQELPEELSFTL